MAKSVLVIHGDDQGPFFLSVAAGTMTLSDNPSRAEILLRDLPITRIRCEIEIDDEAVVITRPSGTAGQAGARRELHAGQGVQLAHSRLHLKAITEEYEVIETEEEAQPASVAAAPGGGAPAAAVTTAGMFKRLRVVDGADLGRAFRLPEVGATSIGKSAKHADIVLHDLYVSRVHCLIEVEGGQVLVQHNEGDKGTLINGQRITAQQELHLGDVLRVGNSHLRLETALTLDSAPAPEEEEGGAAVKDEDEPGEERAAVSAPAAEEAHELVGEVLGNYRIVEVLGQGHSGEVFRAQDLRNNLTVALKVLSPEFPADGEELQKLVGVLKVVTPLHHANLVSIHAVGRSGSHCWIAREYVEGESVAAAAPRLAQRSRINWTRAGRAAVHLARALNFLHRHRIVHGNITPANVLIGDDKTTRLADLMLTRALEGSRLQEAFLEKKLAAELPYLAPEQTEPDAFVDHLADLYGVGAVVYTLLTGRPPFGGDSPAEVIERVRRSRVVRPTSYQRDVPAPFEAVVLKLLAKHQEDRYQTAAELLASVEALAAEHGIEV